MIAPARIIRLLKAVLAHLERENAIQDTQGSDLEREILQTIRALEEEPQR